MGLPIAPNDLVKLAEEAYSASPSAATQSTLMVALSFRAHQALIGQNPTYAKMAKQTERSLESDLLIFVLTREGELQKLELENADVKRLMALRRQTVQKFPEDTGLITWAA